MDYTVNFQQLKPPGQQDFGAKWLLSVSFLPLPNVGRELEVAFCSDPRRLQTSPLPENFRCPHSSAQRLVSS